MILLGNGEEKSFLWEEDNIKLNIFTDLAPAHKAWVFFLYR